MATKKVKTISVWRLEDKHGNGIYRSKNYYDDAVNPNGDIPREIYNSIDRHPNPKFDPELGFSYIKNPYEYCFGFATISQMKQWVYKSQWRKNLSNLGVLLNKYEVDVNYYRRSPFQAIFHKKHAKLVESRKPCYGD